MERIFDRLGLQAVLDRHDEIMDYVVLSRHDRSGHEFLVAYIVPSELSVATIDRVVLSDGLLETLAETMTVPGEKAISAPLPVRFVLVNALPRDDMGNVDESSLKSLPILESSVISTWTESLSAVEGIGRVSLINLPRRLDPEYIHRSDALRNVEFRSKRSVGAPFRPTTEENETRMVNSNAPPAEVQAGGQELTDRLDDKFSLSLANTLLRAVETSPEKGIHYVEQNGGRSFQTYPQLLDAVRSILAAMQNLGVGKGDKILMQCADNRDFVEVFWACVFGGIIPVPMSIAPSFATDNAVMQKLLNVWQVFEYPKIICSDSLAANFEQLCADSVLSSDRLIYLGQLRHDDTLRRPIVEADPAPDSLALLLLTSGSTGTPKAVMHTSQTLINRSAATSALNGFDSRDVSLNWLPLDHVGGIVMFHLRDVYNACSQVQVATSWILEQPLRWLDLIDSERASVTWAPNFAFALIADHAEEISRRQWDLSCMRFILNGGEEIVARTARNFLKLLAKDGLSPSCMKPAWGMSETASAVSYSHRFSLDAVFDSDAAVEVGEPIPTTSLRIVNATNCLLREGEKGNLQIKGASVTPGYYMNPEANRKAFTDDGWFDTGDVGVLNQGQLTITARVKDEIIINGVNYHAAEIEAITESISGIETSYSAVCAVRRGDDDTDKLAVFCAPVKNDSESLASILQNVQQTIAENAGIRPDYIIPTEQSQIPKTNIGKIQRSILRQKFERGEFDHEIRQSEILLGSNVIPSWFYSKSWCPKALPRQDACISKQTDLEKKYLVFADSAGFAAACRQRLEELGARVAIVSVSDRFERQAYDDYLVDPVADSGFRLLMQALQEDDFYPDQIIHCWTYEEPIENINSAKIRLAQHRGLHSLYKLIQSLVEVNSAEKSTALFVVGSDVQQCLREETFVNPHATVVGLLKSAPREHGWLRARHIDFALYRSTEELARQADALVEEIRSVANDDEIVYRDGLRYGWHLTKQRFTGEDLSTCPVKSDGLYAITGGLGGVGGMLAKFLLSQFDIRLILIGRSALPAREEWPELLQRGGPLAERISRYLDIEKSGGEFVYVTADISDFDQLTEIVETAEKDWGRKFSGVFHLAAGGEIGADSIVDSGISACERMFAAKIYGSMAVADLVARYDDAIMVSFGSVIGVFGEAGYASYAAAHTFLAQLTEYYHRRIPGRYFQFDWSAWENIPDYALDYFQTIGFSRITAASGMDSMLAGLCSGQSNLIIGLDSDKWPVRRHLAFERKPLTKTMACFTVTDKSSNIKLSIERMPFYDNFGLSGGCEFAQMDRLPESAGGTVDVSALRSMLAGETTDKTRNPASGMEKQIAAFWRDLLKVDDIGVDCSFFRLGGNSLNATQLISRLKQAYGISLQIRDLFDSPTIYELAELVESRLRTKAGESAAGASPAVDAQGGEVDSATARELLANIDDLSEERVAELIEVMRSGKED